MPLNEQGLYECEDIAFVNTSHFTEAAQHFKKYGFYTGAPKNSREYKQYWDIEEDRRINGMSAPGKLINVNGIPTIQEVHITGEHYGFLNYGRIILTKEKDDNNEYDEKELKFLTGNTINKARKVGKKTIDFPRFIDGQYHWFKAKEYAQGLGLNIVATKARRKGFSYMEGWDCADTVNMNPFLTVLVAAYDYKYITVGNQMMPMAKRYLDFLELHTDFGRGFISEDIEHLKLGYKKREEGNKHFGYLSEIIAVSCGNNPDAAAGKDAVKIKFEECGKFPNLKESLDITLSTTEDGSYATGQIILFGTGGTKDANWADFEDYYYNPDKADAMSFNNVWDEAAKGNGVGFFYPQVLGDPAHLDEHGNSKEKESKEADNSRKEKAKKQKTQSEFVRFIGQRANCPKESFSSGSDNIFPSVEILDQLNRVEHDPDYKWLAREGVLSKTEKGIRFKSNIELEGEGIKIHNAINSFPLKSGSDAIGCYVEWIAPYRDPSTGMIPKGLYRIWNDPYAHDKDSKTISTKDSLGGSYVYERVNNITSGKGDYLCAGYIGRPSTINEYNENLIKMCEYWNAELMFENDRGDVKGHFARAKKSHLLADEPDLEWIKELKGKTVRDKGMNMTEKRKAMAAIYLRDWLMEARGKDAHGNIKLNLHYIYDPALLRELLKWNNKGNFDRTSTLLIGMFDMKECFQKEIQTPKKPDSNDFFNRPLFT